MARPPGFQASLRDAKGLLSPPGVETPGYYQTSLRDEFASADHPALKRWMLAVRHVFLKRHFPAETATGPGGTADNSPPVHWRVSRDDDRVPEGRLKSYGHRRCHRL